MKLRSAEELWDMFYQEKISCSTSKESFMKVISAHTSDIRRVIEEKIKGVNFHSIDYGETSGYCQALTELLDALEILKENK